jgi:hypothetical protein
MKIFIRVHSRTFDDKKKSKAEKSQLILDTLSNRVYLLLSMIREFVMMPEFDRQWQEMEGK